MKKIQIFCLMLFATVCMNSYAFIFKFNRNNNVFFHYYTYHGSDDIKAASFQMTRHSVTTGQPFSLKDNDLLPLTLTKSELYQKPFSVSDITLNIRSGRHKSQQVFNDVKQWGL